MSLHASFRADFTMEQLMAELGLVIEKLWPEYVIAADRAGIPRGVLHTELVLDGWSPKYGRMMATAYAKSADGEPVIDRTLEGGLASPGEPLRGSASSVLEDGCLQVAFVNEYEGREAAGGNLISALPQRGSVELRDLGSLQDVVTHATSPVTQVTPK